MDPINENISILKVKREFKLGITDIVKFLKSKGYSIEPKLTTQLSPEQYNLIKDHCSRNIVSNSIYIPLKTTSVKTDLSWKVGKIKIFNSDKGFGFIECWDDDKDYFIHISNIDDHQILNKGDYVIFKLGPSRNKAGTFEALNLTLVSLFTEDSTFLKAQFFKYDNESFQREILKSLPPLYIIDLLEDEINTISTIDNEIQYNKFLKIIETFIHSIENKEIAEQVLEKKVFHINRIASPLYKVKFWVKGMLPDQPEINILVDVFSESDKELRLEIFKRISILEKTKLINHLICYEKPLSVLDFIVSYLKKSNKIHTYIDIKCELGNEGFWLDKKEFEIYDITRKLLIKVIDNKSKLNLFLNGYTDFFPHEFVFSISSDLSNYEIEKILRSKSLNENDEFLLIAKILEKKLVQVSYDIPLRLFPNIDIDDYLSDEDDNLNEEYKIKYDPLLGILNIAKKLLSTANFAKIESEIIENTSHRMKVFIWENGCKDVLPYESISNFLLEDEKTVKRIERWETISKNEIVNILILNLKNFAKINSRKDFYLFNRHIETLILWETDISIVDNIVCKENKGFLKLIKWISGISDDFDFDEFKTELVFLHPEDQIKFLRKIFWLSHTGNYTLTLEKLDELTRIDFDIFKTNKEFANDIPLDISVDIIIKAIKAYYQNGKFLLNDELMKIVLNDLTVNRKHKFKIHQLFEPCVGRSAAKYNWDQSKGEVKRTNNNWEIKFEYNEKLVNEVKKLPQRKYDSANKLWLVPLAFEESILKFAAQYKFFVEMEGNKYLNNSHFAELVRTQIPNGIKFCEGLKAKKKDQIYNKEFWWCCNKPCYKNCEADHLDPKCINNYMESKDPDYIPF